LVSRSSNRAKPPRSGRESPGAQAPVNAREPGLNEWFSKRTLWGLSRADWACGAVLLAVTLAVFLKGLVDPAGAVQEDAAYFYQPYYQFAADEVRAGRFPHWNPYVSFGMPYHATMQGAVLYPLRWPLFWMSYPAGYVFTIVVHYFLCGLAAYLLMRGTLRCGPPASLIGAVSLAFCGFTMGHVTHPGFYLSLPWVILTVHLLAQAMERGRLIWAVGAAVPVGLMGLIGAAYMLQILVVGLVLWVLEETIVAAVRFFRGRKVTLWLVFLPGAAMTASLGLGACIGMAQLLPGLVQSGLSTRSMATWEFVTEHCAEPTRMMTRLVVPFFYGDNRLGDWGDCNWMDASCYVGALSLMAAVVAVAWRHRDRWVRRFVVLSILMVVLAAGKFIEPPYRFLYDHAPMFNRMRNPIRMLWWMDFSLACLAAVGIDALLRRQAGQAPLRARIAAVATGAIMVLILASCLIRLNRAADGPAYAGAELRELYDLEDFRQSQSTPVLVRFAQQVMRDHDRVIWLGILAAVASIVVVCRLLLSRKAPGPLARGVLVVLLLADLGLFGAGSCLYMKGPGAIQDVPAHARFLQERLGWGRYLCLRGFADETYRNGGMLFRIRHAATNLTGIEHTQRQWDMVSYVFSLVPTAVSLTGVRYLVFPTPVEGAPSVYQDQDAGVYIYENPAAMPRAFLTRTVRFAEGPEEVLRGMNRSDLWEECFVETPVEPLPTSGPGGGEPGQVIPVEDSPGRYVMRTRADGPRQLVLTETYHPEWRCRIDQQVVPVHLTDYTFMSVRVPAGEHLVEWWYEPTTFRQGLVVTVLGCAGVVGAGAAVAVLRWRRRRRLPRAPAPQV
jgi:hypothetical protein